MDIGVLYQLFAATVLPDQNVRVQAEAELKKAEASTGFLPSMLQILGTLDSDPAVRQAAAIYFKNRVQQGWDKSSKQPLEEQDKAFVRQHILRAIVHLPHKIRVQIITCLGVILQNDHPEGRWPQYLQEAMELVQAQEQPAMYAGIAAVHEFVKSYQWGRPEKRKNLDEVIEKGLPILHAVSSKLVLLDDEDAGQMVKTILKTYSATIRLSLSKAQQESSSLVPWGTLFVQVIEKPLPLNMPEMPADPSEREKFAWWKAKKWAYSSLNTLFERYGRKPEKKYQAFSAVFMEHFAPNILHAYLKQVELLVSGVWMSARVKQHLANFIAGCVKPKATWNIIKPHLEAIIIHFIFPLLSFSEEDEQQWAEDPVEYVRKRIDNPLEDFRSPVHAAESLFFDIAKLRSKQTFIPIISLINNIITTYNEASPAQRNPRHKEGALRMMSCLAPLALDPGSPVRGQLEQFIVTNVIPELRSTNAFLRARACETLLCYEDMNFENDSHLQMAFQGILDCLRDEELPVRVAAALAIRPCLKVHSIHEAMRPHVQDIIQALMRLTDEVDMETLTQVTETVVADYSEELAPFATQLATQLRDTFVRLMTEVSAENEDMDYDDALEEKTAAAQGVLRTLCTLVLAMEASPQILRELEIIIAPALTFVLHRNVIDLYEEAFEIIETITFCAKVISPVMWELWPHMYGAFKTDAVDYIDEMSNSLDNYISFGKDVFTQSAEHQRQVMDIIETVLKPENKNLSDTNRSRAFDLIESILLNSRGSVDMHVPRLLDLALPYIQRSGKKAAFRVRCLEVVVNSIYYNPAATLALLEQRGVTGAVLHSWFTILSEFKRVHDKKLCILALCSILELPVEQLPPTLQGAGWTQLLTGLCKVFESYPEALKAREEEEQLYSDGLSDDEDNDVEDEDTEALFKDSKDDEDVLDDEDRYLEMLAQNAAESNPDRGAATFGDAADDDDEDDDWEIEELEEDIFFTTPLDSIDAYFAFEGTMQRLASRPDTSALLQHSINAEQQAFIESVLRQGRENREKKLASQQPQAIA